LWTPKFFIFFFDFFPGSQLFFRFFFFDESKFFFKFSTAGAIFLYFLVREEEFLRGELNTTNNPRHFVFKLCARETKRE
tara:strand:+ start:1041 stop:1277 length:237 start_codon:yes stop_codon:yes gene_type:complete